MRPSPTTIEPVVKTRTVPLDPTAAFDLFTRRIGEWWPLASHSMSEDPGAAVRFEGRVGGRVVEVLPDGTECAWADVLAWDPPNQVVLSWHPSPEPEASSVLDIRFAGQGDGTLVTLEHSGWEEFGAVMGAQLRDSYDQGWELVLVPFEEASRRTSRREAPSHPD